MIETSLYMDKIITHSQTGLKVLLNGSIHPDKLIRIPHGIDIQLFRPPTPGQRADMRRNLNIIPTTACCVGSFQKDGVGWGWYAPQMGERP